MLITPKSQLRLNAFFVKPPSTRQGSIEAPKGGGQSPPNSLRSSTSPTREEAKPRSTAPSPTPRRTQPPDYERSFPPFFLQSYTVISPLTQFLRDDAGLKYAEMKIDEGLAQDGGDADMFPVVFDPVKVLHIPQKYSNNFRQRRSVKELVAEILGSSHFPIDSTSPGSKPLEKARDLLAAIPIKYLEFAEDVRPPYIGTYTKILDTRAFRKLRRNPVTRTLPTVNYNYDSEAEWEELGEGEDLESEGEEEVEDEDGDDIKEFLDDEEEPGEGTRMANSKRGLMDGDLEPVSTGLCWEKLGDPKYSGNDDQGPDHKAFQLEIISGEQKP